MRSSTVVAIALAVASTPAIAAPAPAVPITESQDESGALSFQDVKDFGKGFVKGFTGTLNAATPVIQAAADVASAIGGHRAREVDDESGALKWSDVKHGAEKVAHGVGEAINTLAPAVSAGANLVSSITPFLPHHAREELDEESEALSLKGFLRGAGKVAKTAGKVVSTVAPIAGAVAPLLIREEDGMLVARELEYDESGALSLKGVLRGAGKVAKTAGKVISTVAPIAGAVAPFVIREEDGMLVARDFEEDESGALSLKGLLKGAGKVIKTVAPVAGAVAPLLIREEDGSLYLREFEDDESAALSLKGFLRGAGKVAKTAGKVVSTVAPIAGAVAPLLIREEDLLAREYEDLLMARDYEDYLMAREFEDDESAALSLKGFLRGAGKVAKTAGKVVSTVAPIAGAVAPLLIREEDGMIYAREFDDAESEALSLKGFLRGAGKVAKTAGKVVSTVAPIAGAVAPLLIREEDGMLVARELEYDESGALSLKGILKGAGKVISTVAPIAGAVAPFVLREEGGELVARSLNELD